MKDMWSMKAFWYVFSAVYGVKYLSGGVLQVVILLRDGIPQWWNWNSERRLEPVDVGDVVLIVGWTAIILYRVLRKAIREEIASAVRTAMAPVE
jgi:hypothetical protein